MGLPQRIEVLRDPVCQRGAAIFDTSRGTLDASVETQLRGNRTRFCGSVQRERDEPRPLITISWPDRDLPLDRSGHGDGGLAGGIHRPGRGSRRFLRDQHQAGRHIRTQVIGFRDGRVLSMPLEETDGLQLGDPIMARRRCTHGCRAPAAGPGNRWLRQADGRRGAIEAKEPYDLYAAAAGPLDREHIGQPLVTGIRAIDSLLTCGKGQSIGIFGGSGVGKSTLLGSMSQHSSADVSVIALIGERNREVRDFSNMSSGRRE